MVFYDDNVHRARRLQQLVDSMSNMQTDIKHCATQMDEQNAAMRPRINEMLKERGIDNIDQLIEKAKAQMTPEERAQFEALIKAAKATKAGFDWAYFVGGALMLPEGAILSGKLVIATARFVIRLQAIQGLAKFFRVADGGAAAAGAAAEIAEELEKGALEAEAVAKEAGVAGEAGTEVAEASKIMGNVSKFFKILGVIGFVATILIGILEAIEGAKQKARLIEAIHTCQPARLSVAFFKREGANIMQQFELLKTYLEASVGPEKDEVVARYLSNKIVKNISAENSKIDWLHLEDELEKEDKSSGSYYGTDDLGFQEVVQRAQKKAEDKK